jgi:hypothetical protein
MYYGKDLRTDFFEYYWAYHLRITKLSAVWSWLVQLMLRAPKNIPKRIRWIYFLLWFVALTYAVLLVTGAMTWFNNFSWTKLPSVVLFGNIILNIFAFFFTYYLGDAARYTYPAPGNIEERSKIRKGGIELLDQLHKSKKYSRIIVVGHSLGSMIGYDILKHLWAHYHKNYDVTQTYTREKLDEFNTKSKEGFDLSGDAAQNAYMKLQRELLHEQQERGNNWLISDFITLGSPLAHGELLMAESKKSFGERTEERELPINPPFKEYNGGISYPQPYYGGSGSKARDIYMDIIHHAGHFAFTRWHNLYYKQDYVGGELAPIFGKGIKDTLVKSESFKAKLPFLMHTCYWGEPDKPKGSMKESIEYLKKVILRGAE